MNVPLVEELLNHIKQGQNKLVLEKIAQLSDESMRVPEIQKLKRHAELNLLHSEHLASAKLLFPNYSYQAVLMHLHNQLDVTNYLEIGVEYGKTLALAKKGCAVIGVDPEPKVGATIRGNLRLFATKSDKFFENFAEQEILPGSLDFAFIDGLHTYDQTVKDVLNTLPYMKSNGVIALHDTWPITSIVAARNRETRFWTGDVWIAVGILKNMLSEANIFTLPAHPSGLTLITDIPKLNIPDNLMDILAENMGRDLEATDLRKELNVIDYASLDEIQLK